MSEDLGSSMETFEWLFGQMTNPRFLDNCEAHNEILEREFPNGDKLGDVCYADIKGWYKRTKLKAKGKKLHIYVGIAAPCKGYLLPTNMQRIIDWMPLEPSSPDLPSLPSIPSLPSSRLTGRVSRLTEL